MAFMEDTIKLIQHRITPMDSEHKDININRTFHRDDYKSLDTIIELLQRGEKYEKIFNTILNWTMHDGSFIPVKELINLEQKYFPKEANNDK